MQIELNLNPEKKPEFKNIVAIYGDSVWGVHVYFPIREFLDTGTRRGNAEIGREAITDYFLNWNEKAQYFSETPPYELRHNAFRFWGCYFVRFVVPLDWNIQKEPSGAPLEDSSVKDWFTARLQTQCPEIFKRTQEKIKGVVNEERFNRIKLG